MEEIKSDLTNELHSFFSIHFNYQLKTRNLKKIKLYKQTLTLFNQLFFKAIHTLIKTNSEFPNHTLKQVLESLAIIFFKLGKFIVLNSQRSPTGFVLYSSIDLACYQTIISEMTDKVLEQIRFGQELIQQVRESELYKSLSLISETLNTIKDEKVVPMQKIQSQIKPLVDGQKLKALIEIQQKFLQYEQIVTDNQELDPQSYLGENLGENLNWKPQDFFEALNFIQNLKATKELQLQIKKKLIEIIQKIEKDKFQEVLAEFFDDPLIKPILDFELSSYLRKVYFYLSTHSDQVPKSIKKVIIQKCEQTSLPKAWPVVYEAQDPPIEIDLKHLYDGQERGLKFSHSPHLTFYEDKFYPYIRQVSDNGKKINATIRIPKNLKFKLNQFDLIKVNMSDYFYVCGVQDYYQKFRIKNVKNFFDFKEVFTDEEMSSIEKFIQLVQMNTIQPQSEQSNIQIDLRFKPDGQLEGKVVDKVNFSKRQIKIGRYQDKELPYQLDIQYKPNKMNISEEQCMIEFLDDGGYCISDEKSEKGSYFYLQGGGKDYSEPYNIPMYDGIEIIIGKVKYIFNFK